MNISTGTPTLSGRLALSFDLLNLNARRGALKSSFVSNVMTVAASLISDLACRLRREIRSASHARSGLRRPADFSYRCRPSNILHYVVICQLQHHSVFLDVFLLSFRALLQQGSLPIVFNIFGTSFGCRPFPPGDISQTLPLSTIPFDNSSPVIAVRFQCR